MKTLILLLAFSSTLWAQDSAQPDRWRGTILNQTTPIEAIAKLGPPASDKLASLKVFRIQKWLTKKTADKAFRVLEYKKPEGLDKARLYFLNDKLVAIEIDVKKGIEPIALSNIYGVAFQPMVSAVDIAFNPRDYERNQGKVYPKSYPIEYAMVAVSEHSFISAMIDNQPSFGGVFAKSAGIQDQPGSFPGKVAIITLVSRTLENRDGSDVLK